MAQQLLGVLDRPFGRPRCATLFTDDEMNQLRELYLLRQLAFREARERGSQQRRAGLDPFLDP